MTPEAIISMRSGEEVNIGLLKDISSKMGKHVGWGVPNSTIRIVLNSYDLVKRMERKMTLCI